MSRTYRASRDWVLWSDAEIVNGAIAPARESGKRPDKSLQHWRRSPRRAAWGSNQDRITVQERRAILDTIEQKEAA